ncbi:hypothetical protein BOX15_Mlig009296g1, partial [Macrostomum lignano]
RLSKRLSRKKLNNFFSVSFSAKMQCWTLIAVLLGVACWASPALGSGYQQQQLYTDVNSFARVGTTKFRGSSLNVFEIDGVQVAEPRVAFRASCNALKYSRVYMKYRLTLSVSIDANTLRSAKDGSKKVGQVTITGLKVKANKGLSSRQSGLSLMTILKNSGRSADLVFLCSSFRRCQYLREELLSNPSDVAEALQFEAFGRVGSSPVRFGAVRGASLPRLRCNRRRWIVFQRRVDGSLSFAQNWDAYVKGFGNPRSNYWMGLDRLSEMTKTSIKNGYKATARCRLRLETQSFDGKKYKAEFRMFEVLGPEQRYLLRVGQQVGKTALGTAFVWHNGGRFSTYDKDHDAHRGGSCSQKFGYGGWWYKACHGCNINGAYTTDKKITNNPTYNTVHIPGRGYVPMKRTVMKFKCY